jgi:hypothetical protein
MEEGKIENKDVEKNHKKALRTAFVVIILCALFFVLVYFFLNSARNFEYKGITGNVVREGNIIFYQISLPVEYQGKTVPYNFYLRNDPNKLQNIPFNGSIVFKKNVVINSTGNLSCEGFGVIGVANLVQLYEILGAKVIRDENASCDALERYLFLQIEEGNETRIDQTNNACYTIKISNCKILEATERLMYETISEAKKSLTANS